MNDSTDLTTTDGKQVADNRLWSIFAAYGEPDLPDWTKATPTKPAKPLDSYDNLEAFLKHLQIEVAYNQFTHEIDLVGVPGHPIYDDDFHKRLWSFATRYMLEYGEQRWVNFVTTMALENAYHPLREWFDHLQFHGWDGVNRLDTWLQDYCFAEDSEYTRWVSRTSLMINVRRIRAPGFPWKYCPVLEGEQTIGKSPVTKIVSKGYFSDNVDLTFDSKQLMEVATGVMIFEFAEMHSRGKADIGKMKALLARNEFKARLAFGRVAKTIKRQFSFWGTINPDALGYLNDPTGNERWLPIKCNAVLTNGRDTRSLLRLEDLQRDIDQLYAEAAIREAAARDDDFRLPDNVRLLANIEQGKRQEVDDIAKDLTHVLADVSDGFIPNGDVYAICGLLYDPSKPHVTRKVHAAMHALGWEETTRRVACDGKNAKPKKTRGYAKGEVPSGTLPKALHYDSGTGDVVEAPLHTV